MKILISKVFKTLIYWVLILFFVWIIYKNGGDYSKVLSTLQTASYIDLGWAFLFAIGNLAILSLVYKINFKIFRNEASHGSLLLEIISFSFLTVSNPLGYSIATAYTIKRLVKKGFTYIGSIFGFYSSQLATSIGYFPILGLTVWYLSKLHQLTNYEILAAQILIVVNVVIIAIIAFVLVLPIFSIQIAKLFAKIMNFSIGKILGKEIFNERNLESEIKEIQKAALRFDQYFFTFSKSVLVSIIYHLINILVLYLSFKTFNYIPNIEIIFALYGIIVLFSIISPTPLGIGIVEGIAQLGAVSMGLESEKALVVILVYRFLSVWLPAFIGFFIFRKFKKQS